MDFWRVFSTDTGRCSRVRWKSRPFSKSFLETSLSFLCLSNEMPKSLLSLGVGGDGGKGPHGSSALPLIEVSKKRSRDIARRCVVKACSCSGAISWDTTDRGRKVPDGGSGGAGGDVFCVAVQTQRFPPQTLLLSASASRGHRTRFLAGARFGECFKKACRTVL